MTEVTQTIIAGDPSGRPGNCLQAAVASLLDLALDDVPHFAERPDWEGALAAFAEQHGYRLEHKPVGCPPARGLAFGPSPRGLPHAVVVRGAEIWDPHPDRTGLMSISTFVDFEQREAS